MMYSPGLHPRGETQREEQRTMVHMKTQQAIARDRRAPIEKEALEKGVSLAAVNMAVTITELQNLVVQREALQNAFAISGDRLIHAVIQTDHRYQKRMALNKAQRTSSKNNNAAPVASSASSRCASDATVTANHPGTDQVQDAHMAVEELEEESSSGRHDSVGDDAVTTLKPDWSRRRSSISYRAEN